MDWLSIKEFLKDMIKYIILIVVILFIAIYVVGLQQVVGQSMAPNYNNGDVLILDKISYKFVDIKRGDIISFYYADTKYLIKRVIGLPGEVIEFKNNTLYVDGEELKEEYLNKVVTDDFLLQSLGVNEIPKDMYFVLGDNRQDSLDSRSSRVGLVKKSDIVGKLRLKIWPINKIGIVK